MPSRFLLAPTSGLLVLLGNDTIRQEFERESHPTQSNFWIFIKVITWPYENSNATEPRSNCNKVDDEKNLIEQEKMQRGKKRIRFLEFLCWHLDFHCFIDLFCCKKSKSKLYSFVQYNTAVVSYKLVRLNYGTSWGSFRSWRLWSRSVFEWAVSDR